jgi:hypothetical protein
VCCCAQLASGEVFGKNQPIALQLLGSQRSREALEGVAMELEDSLYPLLREVRGAGGALSVGGGGGGGDVGWLLHSVLGTRVGEGSEGWPVPTAV